MGDFLGHLWIPVVVIALASTAWQSRVMRANLLDVLEYQYVQTARAKGVREWIVIWKHAVRNALAPLVMSLGTQLPALFSGELVVSIVLNLPTDGPIYFAALQDKDTNLAIALLMATASLLVVGNLVAGHAVVVGGARRDEGTSYHYVPPTRIIEADARVVAAMMGLLDRTGIAHVVGRTWTTDAFYRETRPRVERRVDEGCIVVEMEAAALLAVARYRHVALGRCQLRHAPEVPVRAIVGGWRSR